MTHDNAAELDAQDIARLYEAIGSRIGPWSLLAVCRAMVIVY